MGEIRFNPRPIRASVRYKIATNRDNSLPLKRPNKTSKTANVSISVPNRFIESIQIPRVGANLLYNPCSSYLPSILGLLKIRIILASLISSNRNCLQWFSKPPIVQPLGKKCSKLTDGSKFGWVQNHPIQQKKAGGNAIKITMAACHNYPACR